MKKRWRERERKTARAREREREREIEKEKERENFSKLSATHLSLAQHGLDSVLVRRLGDVHSDACACHADVITGQS